jgi:hypothetical protein
VKVPLVIGKKGKKGAEELPSLALPFPGQSRRIARFFTGI